MNGGYGSDDYPGQGYDGQGYGEEGQGWDRRQPRDGSVWQGDQGYASYDTPGYGGQDFDAPANGGYGNEAYGNEAYGNQAYGEPGYDGQGYGQPGHQGEPGYPAQPGQRGGTGSQRAMRGSGGMSQLPPGYDPRADRSRRMNAGYEPRDPGYGQGGYDEWGQEQGDSSFLPGFGQGDQGYGQGGYDDRRGPGAGGPGAGRPGAGGQGTGAGARGPAGRGQAGQGGQGGRGQAGPAGRGGPSGPAQRLREDDRRPRDPWDDDRNGRGGGNGRNGGGGGNRPRRRATRWIPRILILLIVGAIVGGGLTGGLYIYHKYEARYHPADYAGAGTTPTAMVQIQSGETASQLAPTLVQLGVVASERAFVVAAEASTSTASLEPGFYMLNHHMKATLAYAALLNQKNRVQTTVTIPEGKRVSQILTILAAHTKIPLPEFEAAAKQTSKLGLPSYAGTTAKLPSAVKYGQLEGYLFPATYAVVPHETALQILQAMVARYNAEAQQLNIVTAAKSVGLTPSQLIIEASMVQAEAGVNADMPKMARVIINRKARGMPDGFSSVDFYGLGKYGINLTNSAEAQASGPYDNTQKVGLPPTPIDNPGELAIKAVLHPEPGPWLYFVTTAVGKPTKFSATCFQGTCG
ncbi:endolytic transglycosylase MltG [Trebonia kvetii]|uniref:Endolytic murein transglycosylase n=1 Tax=Trebonia kvetii TaxID=2480626 RepID=A0A6P2BR89_9ACTN|nr:endolytic transglycosylase MltG [Trebonia kvetii]TVZ00971.1 endolytic transglycosylase MltG [Trebonia kvetii]